MEKRPNIRDIPARCEYSRAIEPYRILEAGASLGLPERPEMRDTLLFSIKKDARSAKIQLQSNPHLRTHKISPGVRRSCPPRGCYPILVRPGEATVILAYRSGRLSVARDRFEVLGVRGDINKSTTFGTEDKCNPLEVTIGAALRYQTLRSLTATEIGAGTAT